MNDFRFHAVPATSKELPDWQLANQAAMPADSRSLLIRRINRLLKRLRTWW
jgi:hypothetical protein